MSDDGARLEARLAPRLAQAAQYNPTGARQMNAPEQLHHSEPGFSLYGILATDDSLIVEGDPNSRGNRDEAVLRLDQEGDLWISVDAGRDSHMQSFNDWSGQTRRWSVLLGPAELDVARLRRDLSPSGCLHALFGRVAAGLDSEWDGYRHMGTLTEDAAEASTMLDDHFSVTDYSTGVEVWEAEEWIQGEFGELDADTTDEVLHELTERLEEEARELNVFLVGTREALDSHRESLRE